MITNSKGILVIIPSIREVKYEYLEPLSPGTKTDILIIDDSDSMSKAGLPNGYQIIDYADRKKLLGPADLLVPKKSPSCKGAGLYKAWRDGYSQVILLDDDCDCRVTPDFLDQNPVDKRSYFPLTHGQWINTLGLLSDDAADEASSPSRLFARGFPYWCRFSTKVNEPKGCQAYGRVVFNAGLWCGEPDINGIDKLNEKLAGRTWYSETARCKQSFCVENNQRLPLSAMNVQLSRELIPAFYQPPDYTIGDWKIRRHDDVWSGMYVKKVIDSINSSRLEATTSYGDMPDKLLMTVGNPIVWHRKQGDSVREAVGEHISNLCQSSIEDVIFSSDKTTGGVSHFASSNIRSADPFEIYWFASSLAKSYRAKRKTFTRNDKLYEIIQSYLDSCECWSRLFV